MPRPRNSSHGEEERHRAQSAVCRDSGLYVDHLLRQDRHAHHQPDVCVQGAQKTPLCRDHRLKYDHIAATEVASSVQFSRGDENRPLGYILY